MGLTASATPIEGLLRVDCDSHRDERGAFTRLFCASELAPLLGERRIVQINQSLTRQAGAVRGLHFQHFPYAEMKLVRCIRGQVWDVVADLRRDSPTFLLWHAEVLSEENRRLLVIPEGCAHGFQVLEEDSEMLYLHTEFYRPEAESGVCHDDPALTIDWPLPVRDLSARDRRHPPITMDFRGLAR
ncbi:dTDP-4-dehydrorhamnose 3,5-epimerase [Pseudomonas sp. PA15(2017)]|uniref:dTDP-4-dehydrorhamnose 3,5-epimerase family protein n=1 Tax=Pseudomonas sp. PA15(2017) TaxID=1932111 RepID=UPI00095CB24E|nr:dTDP-4-dehydrorhamnose 3,5-epimerase family protein [Pseudomonas sp. PA15(2017)]OLU32685.1 dTDP-4-dehydrorhamnose 3,5-epimerase [Pseudomonas sp. PA15(2017)]